MVDDPKGPLKGNARPRIDVYGRAFEKVEIGKLNDIALGEMKNDRTVVVHGSDGFVGDLIGSQRGVEDGDRCSGLRVGDDERRNRCRYAGKRARGKRAE